MVDHFISDRVIEDTNSEVDYAAQSTQVKLNKRKTREVQYEGDPRYVANMYEALVNDVNN